MSMLISPYIGRKLDQIFETSHFTVKEYEKWQFDGLYFYVSGSSASIPPRILGHNENLLGIDVSKKYAPSLRQKCLRRSALQISSSCKGKLIFTFCICSGTGLSSPLLTAYASKSAVGMIGKFRKVAGHIRTGASLWAVPKLARGLCPPWNP